MEYFLVFLLGIALAVVIFFVIRPGLFTRSKQDFELFQTVFEDALEELDQKRQHLLQEIDARQGELLDLHHKLTRDLGVAHGQSPKVLAVLELAQQKQDPASIAKKLGLGVGEVELILGLNKDWETLAECD